VAMKTRGRLSPRRKEQCANGSDVESFSSLGICRMKPGVDISKRRDEGGIAGEQI
jgi:hypothetical protein